MYSGAGLCSNFGISTLHFFTFVVGHGFFLIGFGHNWGTYELKLFYDSQNG